MDKISYSLAAKAIKQLKEKADLKGNSVEIPYGTTAERPTLTVTDKAMRFNTDTGGLENWDGSTWVNVSADISAVNLQGTDTEANILAKTGMIAEDLWIASDTLDGWVYDGTQWVNIGPLQGPQGEQGTAGNTWLNGTVDPTTEGVDGDLYLNTASSYYFKKITGSWVYQGTLKGNTGNGIDSIQYTSTAGLVDTYTVTYTDASTDTITVTNGVSVSGIAKTNTVGLIDTYTVSYSDGSTSTFDVVNGQPVDHVSLTSGTGAAGTTDTYTVWGDVAETVVLGTFDVYNGVDGTGSTLSSLTDVDVTTISPTEGQTLVWDSVNSEWVAGSQIDDTQTAANTTWSSDKTSSEFSATNSKIDSAQQSAVAMAIVFGG